MANDNETIIKYEEEYITNSRGMKLFACSWSPKNQEPKALIFICHGYAMESSITMNSTATRLVKAGFACYGIDYEGHGKSDGLECFIESFDVLVDDCFQHFRTISEREENKGKMKYLLGESMGGALLILLHLKRPDFWHGGILVAPMCKISNDLQPSPLVVNVLEQLCRFVPTWKLIPSQDIIEIAFKVPEIRQQIRMNPFCYKGRPRLKTGYELYKATIDVENSLGQISFPFLILHGEADRVTDLSVSQKLYDLASSSDKSFKTYREMWHGLLYGETPENIDIVFSDIINWLEERCSSNTKMDKDKQVKNKYESKFSEKDML